MPINDPLHQLYPLKRQGNHQKHPAPSNCVSDLLMNLPREISQRMKWQERSMKHLESPVCSKMPHQAKSNPQSQHSFPCLTKPNLLERMQLNEVEKNVEGRWKQMPKMTLIKQIGGSVKPNLLEHMQISELGDALKDEQSLWGPSKQIWVLVALVTWTSNGHGKHESLFVWGSDEDSQVSQKSNLPYRAIWNLITLYYLIGLPQSPHKALQRSYKGLICINI